VARPSNTLEMASITMTVTPQIKFYLEMLGNEGLYTGTSASDVAKALLTEHLREMLYQNKLPKLEMVEGKLRPVEPTTR
jgi:hypothetical protein